MKELSNLHVRARVGIFKDRTMSRVTGFSCEAGLIAFLLASAQASAQDASSYAADMHVQDLVQTAVNPNLDEWNLVNLTSTDVSSAKGGSGVKVALLDGLTDCRHADLNGHCSSTKTTGGKYRFYSNHGTHTAGTIAGKTTGIAPNATILNYAVFDDRGWVPTGNQLVSIWQSAYNAGARIASMSFGCSKIALCFSATEVSQMANASQPSRRQRRHGAG